MEGPDKSLVLSRGLSLVILIGIIGIAASPFTQMYTPVYPIYRISEFEEDLVLNDDFPMFEFASPFADKIVLEELTTNGSPVTIKLYNTYSSEDPNTIIQNITEIRDIFLVGSSSEASIAPVFRISRYRNESVRITIIFRSWGSYPSTDNITMGPSIFLVLALPLAWSMYKNWGYRLDRRGYVILFLIILSGILIAPVLVYTYNGGSALLRQDEVQDVRTFSFMLNGSNPLQEFHESIDTTGTSSFVRIAELDTNRTPVSITVNADEDTQTLHLSNITVYPSSPIQIELPRENITGFTLQFDWIVQNASISFSIETVNNVWAPRIDPMPNTQSGLIGLSILMISLALPRNSETRLPDNSSLS